MKKLKMFKTISCFAFALPVGFISACALVSSPLVGKRANKENPIPPELLNIEVQDDGTKILYGFKPEVTADQIRIAGYDTLVIPENVVEIKPYAFAYMFDGLSSKVTNLVLNKEIRKIGKGAFIYCYGLTKGLDLHDKDSLEVIEQDAFNYCPGFAGSLVLPDNLVKIGANAFKNCERLTYVCFNRKLKEVGDYAFDGCINLVQLDFTKCIVSDDDDRQFLPSWANLKTYAFTNIGSKPEAQETEKQIIVWDLSIPEEEWIDIFRNNLNIPEDFKIFHSREACDENTLILKEEDGQLTLKGFKNGVDLSKYNLIRVPKGVKRIGISAFRNMTNRMQIIFNDELESIDAYAFQDAVGFNGPLNLPNSIKEIGVTAFYSATNFSGTAVIPYNVSEVEAGIFLECYGLTGIVFHRDITTLGTGIACYSPVSVLDMSDLPSTGPTWTYVIEEFLPAPLARLNSGNVILPWNEDFTTTNLVFKQSLISGGLADDSTFDSLWLTTMNKNKGKIFPHHPEQPMEGLSYMVNGTQLRGLRDYIREGEELIKTDYEVIQIPSNISEIASNAFDGTFKVNDDEVHQTNWRLQFRFGVNTIGTQAFKDCSGIVGDVTLPASLTTISDNAFEGCSNISSIKLPLFLTHIGQSPFKGCSRLACINCKDYTSIPEWLSTGDTKFFSGLPATGKIFISDVGHRDAWKAAAKKHGLPDNWSIEPVA